MEFLNIQVQIMNNINGIEKSSVTTQLLSVAARIKKLGRKRYLNLHLQSRIQQLTQVKNVAEKLKVYGKQTTCLLASLLDVCLSELEKKLKSHLVPTFYQILRIHRQPFCEVSKTIPKLVKNYYFQHGNVNLILGE